jgi:hypothetical protein
VNIIAIFSRPVVCYSSNLEALFATILQYKALLDIVFPGEILFDTSLALETLIATADFRKTWRI